MIKNYIREYFDDFTILNLCQINKVYMKLQSQFFVAKYEFRSFYVSCKKIVRCLLDQKSNTKQSFVPENNLLIESFEEVYSKDNFESHFGRKLYRFAKLGKIKFFVWYYQYLNKFYSPKYYFFRIAYMMSFYSGNMKLCILGTNVTRGKFSPYILYDISLHKLPNFETRIFFSELTLQISQNRLIIFDLLNYELLDEAKYIYSKYLKDGYKTTFCFSPKNDNVEILKLAVQNNLCHKYFVVNTCAKRDFIECFKFLCNWYKNDFPKLNTEEMGANCKQYWIDNCKKIIQNEK